ncbi:MBOAT, membrane-bound O-acyltransferase family-domain-containing protein [Flammula alnicola]|nr:MBOAT, membrane-bound O-acyltransferase family-domain-containing protein [Flammula alnicola]
MDPILDRREIWAAWLETCDWCFETSTGTLYVSKPYPRESVFDIANLQSSTNEFRGFFSLFWISIFIFSVQTYVRSIETNGHALNLQFASMFSQDAVTLALSDAFLVLSTGICNRWIRYHWTGVILQHLLQTTILFGAICWTFNRNWPWVQSGYLTLHSLVMVMKMHSYITVNGQLQVATEHIGGWDKAIASPSPPNDVTPGRSNIPEGSSTSYVDVKTAHALRKRLAAVAAQNTVSAPVHSEDHGHQLQSKDGSKQHGTTFVVEEDLPEGLAPHPLVAHPDPQISAMASDYSELQSELISSGPCYVRWPDTITWKNFAVYQLIPTLVYELEYPRTDRIRPLYVFEKTVCRFRRHFRHFALLYTVTESFILPYTPTADQSFLRSLLDLALPFMMARLLCFAAECICNGFAELSYFADRQWNSTSWDEFSRKWNKPVYAFLLRHVYAQTIMSYRLSKTTAMFITFFISACAHELVMAVVSRKLRMYLFTLQLIQIPLIVIGRMPSIKRNRLMGNVVFWLGLYAGFPLLCVAYARIRPDLGEPERSFVFERDRVDVARLDVHGVV